MSTPLYGQRSNPYAAPECPRHPGVRSVDYCKKCNRPMCVDCTVRTEVRSVCVECANVRRPRVPSGQPVVTYTLIGINVALFILSFVLPSVGNWLFFNPAVGYRQVWRFLTTAFLHSGFMHIAFNMLALYSVGIELEQVLGRTRYLSVYLLSAIGASLFVLAWVLIQPSSLGTVTVGASGAVFGLFGAMFVLQKQSGMDTRAVVGLLLVNLLIGFIVPNVSWQGHVGGLATGALATWIYWRQGRAKPGITAKKQERQALWITVGMYVAVIALIGLTYEVIFEVLG